MPYVDQAGHKLTKILLPLPSEYWGEGVFHQAQLHIEDFIDIKTPHEGGD